jgi:hypothetical protein
MPVLAAINIIQAIPPRAKLYIVVDAARGYHLIHLAENSRDLTGFLLPSGILRYCRGPMGLLATSDKCFCQSNYIIQGFH